MTARWMSFLKKAAEFVERSSEELVNTLANPAKIPARSLFSYRNADGPGGFI